MPGLSTPAERYVQLAQIAESAKTWNRLMTTTTKIAQTPKVLIWSLNKAKLYRYIPVAPIEQRHRIPLLMVFAIINRPYVLDLRPGHSFVEYMLRHALVQPIRNAKEIERCSGRKMVQPRFRHSTLARLADATSPDSLRHRPLHARSFGVLVLEALGSLTLAPLLERLVLLAWATTDTSPLSIRTLRAMRTGLTLTHRERNPNDWILAQIDRRVPIDTRASGWTSRLSGSRHQSVVKQAGISSRYASVPHRQPVRRTGLRQTARWFQDESFVIVRIAKGS